MGRARIRLSPGSTTWGRTHPFDFTNREELPLGPPGRPCRFPTISVPLRGYCYDFGRSVFFGEPDAEYRRVHALVMGAQAAGIAALDTGGTCAPGRCRGPAGDCRRVAMVRPFAIGWVMGSAWTCTRPRSSPGRTAPCCQEACVSPWSRASLCRISWVTVEDVVVVRANGRRADDPGVSRVDRCQLNQDPQRDHSDMSLTPFVPSRLPVKRAFTGRREGTKGERQDRWNDI